MKEHLFSMLKTDQDARRLELKAIDEGKTRDSEELLILMKKTEIIDQENLIELERLLSTCGWPKKDVVGIRVSEAAAVLSLHAGQKFWDKYLSMMEMALKQGDLAPDFYGMLIDKMLMEQGKLQRYGTQIDMFTNKMMPIEDETHLNDRRQEIGLTLLGSHPLPQTFILTIPDLPAKPTQSMKSKKTVKSGVKRT